MINIAVWQGWRDVQLPCHIASVLSVYSRVFPIEATANCSADSRNYKLCLLRKRDDYLFWENCWGISHKYMAQGEQIVLFAQKKSWLMVGSLFFFFIVTNWYNFSNRSCNEIIQNQWCNDKFIIYRKLYHIRFFKKLRSGFFIIFSVIRKFLKGKNIVFKY